MKRARVINKPLAIRTQYPSSQESIKAGVMTVGDEALIVGKVKGERH